MVTFLVLVEAFSLIINFVFSLCFYSLQKIPQHPPGPREMQVFAKCDDFMSALMQRLGQDIPQFLLKRRVKLSTSAVGGDDQSLLVTVTGLNNHSDKPYSFIKVSDFCPLS